MSVPRHLSAVPQTEGAVICLTGSEARDAASMIGLALHANKALCDLQDAGALAETEHAGLEPLRFPETLLGELTRLQAALYEAAGDSEGMAAALLSRAALRDRRAPEADAPPNGSPSRYEGLTRPQERCADRIMSEYGRAVVDPQCDGSVHVTALLDDNAVYTVCVEADGSERWRR